MFLVEMSYPTKTDFLERGKKKRSLKLNFQYEIHESEKILTVSAEMSDFREVIQHPGPLNQPIKSFFIGE